MAEEMANAMEDGEIGAIDENANANLIDIDNPAVNDDNANITEERARIAALEAELAEVRARLEQGSSSRVSSVMLESLIANALQQLASPSHAHTNGNNQIAKALHKPDIWVNDANGSKRAETWLKQVETYAVAHGVEPQCILPSYLGPAIATLYDDYVRNWALQNITPSWQEVCATFKGIVGQKTDLEKTRIVDDLTHGRVRQTSNQSILTYKVKFQHNLMIAGDICNLVAVNLFISGLGCNHLRAECQPDLMNNKLSNIEEAYEHAVGKERMLKEKGVKPFGCDPHVQAVTSGALSTPPTGTMAVMQSGSRSKGKDYCNAEGRKICHVCDETYDSPKLYCRNKRFHGKFTPKPTKQGVSCNAKFMGNKNWNNHGGGGSGPANSNGNKANGGVAKPQWKSSKHGRSK